MSNSQNETDELKTLQREAAELRAERKGRRSKAKSGAEEESQESKTKRRRSKATSDAAQASQTVEEQRVTEPPPQDTDVEERAPEEERVPELDKTIQDLVTHIESVAKELQEATIERPALGLLAAFTTGIVVGYLLTRRY